jgi:hypothetical protein
MTAAEQLQRFINKHGHAINTLLQLAVEQDTPTTTNALESKNGTFSHHPTPPFLAKPGGPLPIRKDVLIKFVFRENSR